MRYADLAAFFERLEGTPGRLDMTRILVEMLGHVAKGEMVATVRLLQGAVAPDWEGVELGLAEKQILKALAIAGGGSTKSEEALAELTALYHEKGDLGLAAEAVLGRGGGRKQVSLFGAEPTTVTSVFADLQAIAATTGAGSQDAKQRLLAKLLLAATPLEARYITRTVAGRLRLGVADMTFLDALTSWHLGRGVRSVQEQDEAERVEQQQVRARLERAYDLRSDLAVVADALARGGMQAVEALGIEVGVPLRPMAAERLKTLPEILEKMRGRVALEYKYDGLRIQAHVPAKGPVRLFSRRLEEMTAQFPDVARHLTAALAGRDCIVEGEAVALDAQGRLRPFQDISRRRGRKTDLERMAQEVPVTLFLFDCLAVDGKPTMAESYAARRARLAKMVPAEGPVRLSALQEAATAEGMEQFFDQAVADGAEGIMCKDPEAPYKAGSRGFAWIKFKTDYTEALVDTMDLVVMGAYAGRGRRAGWYGALLMGAYDAEEERWLSVCKLGTGFDDATLGGLKERFARHVLPAPPLGEKPAWPKFYKGKSRGGHEIETDASLLPDVLFEPAIVMEIQAAELSVSPKHVAGYRQVQQRYGKAGGLAARFPRFTGRWRTDKGPKDATTVAELVAMFEAQRPQEGKESVASGLDG